MNFVDTILGFAPLWTVGPLVLIGVVMLATTPHRRS